MFLGIIIFHTFPYSFPYISQNYFSVRSVYCYNPIYPEIKLKSAHLGCSLWYTLLVKSFME